MSTHPTQRRRGKGVLPPGTTWAAQLEAALRDLGLPFYDGSDAGLAAHVAARAGCPNRPGDHHRLFNRAVNRAPGRLVAVCRPGRRFAVVVRHYLPEAALLRGLVRPSDPRLQTLPVRFADGAQFSACGRYRLAPAGPRLWLALARPDRPGGRSGGRLVGRFESRRRAAAACRVHAAGLRPGRAGPDADPDPEWPWPEVEREV